MNARKTSGAGPRPAQFSAGGALAGRGSAPLRFKRDVKIRRMGRVATAIASATIALFAASPLLMRVTRPTGLNLLYHNNGDGTFTDVTAKAGVPGGGWSASAGFFDYDNDGKLDLFVTRYLDWDIAHNLLCGARFRIYCRPDKFGATASILYHNNGDGTFRDV